MKDWHIGEHIVCVSDFEDTGGSAQFPIKGQVYTIRSIEPTTAYEGHVAFLLEEIQNIPMKFLEGIDEIHWLDIRFRPVKKSAIEVFQAMLTPVTEDA